MNDEQTPGGRGAPYQPETPKELGEGKKIVMDNPGPPGSGGGGGSPSSTKSVSLDRPPRDFHPSLLLSVVIENSTKALSFNTYKAYMDYVMCGEPLEGIELSQQEITKIQGPKRTRYNALKGKRYLPYTDADAYRLLKVATEAFVAVNCAVLIDKFDWATVNQAGVLDRVDSTDPGPFTTVWQNYLKAVNGTTNKILPYLAFIKAKLPEWDLFAPETPVTDEEAEEHALCYDILQDKLTNPCLLELIWSYWHEEGMLVQTANAISRRFQNIRGPAERDPLAMMEIDPLRPLNNLLWGYVQDEQHRLSLVRRTYEYDHHYGLTLVGKAVPPLQTADSRSKFLEAFHSLLHLCSVFYGQDDDLTVRADAFAVLHALKDVHLLLVEGQHNQFGDLPSTARIEMLMQEWLLARPEFREFLPTRIMVDYPEPWMDRVDAMKRLQGWTDTNVLHFRNLAVFGEQILLSIRFGDWRAIEDSEAAALWARFLRNQIQGYIHAYRTATGVDLTADVTSVQDTARRYTQPSVLLRERLPGGAPSMLPAGAPTVTPAGQPVTARGAVARTGRDGRGPAR